MADDLAALRAEVGALRDELGVLSANVPQLVDSVLAPEVNDFREALATTRAELQQEHNRSMAEFRSDMDAIVPAPPPRVPAAPQQPRAPDSAQGVAEALRTVAEFGSWVDVHCNASSREQWHRASDL